MAFEGSGAGTASGKITGPSGASSAITIAVRLVPLAAVRITRWGWFAGRS
jgi:hypothetical protein